MCFFLGRHPLLNIVNLTLGNGVRSLQTCVEVSPGTLAAFTHPVYIQNNFLVYSVTAPTMITQLGVCKKK